MSRDSGLQPGVSKGRREEEEAMAFLRFEGIGKSFPGVKALDDVTFEVREGSCHALMGENGAGKSTLGKILAGVYTAERGRITLAGKEISPRNPLEARMLGIAMVHQELAFCPNLTVAENLSLGDMPTRGIWLDREGLRDRARAVLAEIGAEIDVDARVETLSTGQEQMLQIAAAVGTGAKVIVMDEPTSSLSGLESEHLFRLMGRLQQRRITLLYVSHRMEEIHRLCDTITVLRDGRHVMTHEAGAVKRDELIRQMIGRDVEVHDAGHVGGALGEVVLEVKGLRSPGRFRDMSLTVRRGEVVGMAGLVGAGRSEVAQAIFGLDPEATGEVRVNGRRLKLGHPRLSLAEGMGYVPEDRKRQGLVLTMNCRENTTLAVLNRLAKAGFVNGQNEAAMAGRHLRQLRVRTPDMEAGVAGLSGGNQQKIALAKWLAMECGLLIVDEPTRGVDVGAKAEIHRMLDELASRGMAILLISSELPEVIGLSRRVVVMRQGRIVGEAERPEIQPEKLLRWMAGVEESALSAS